MSKISIDLSTSQAAALAVWSLEQSRKSSDKAVYRDLYSKIMTELTRLVPDLPEPPRYKISRK